MSRQEAVEFISRKVYGHVSNELLSSSNCVGISRSESMSMKMSCSIGNDSCSSSQLTNNAALPLLNISFVVQEKEKLANWKKRYENQASCKHEHDYEFFFKVCSCMHTIPKCQVKD